MLSVYSQLWTNFDQLALDGGAWRLGLGFCRDGLIVHLDRVWGKCGYVSVICLVAVLTALRVVCLAS